MYLIGVFVPFIILHMKVFFINHGNGTTIYYTALWTQITRFPNFLDTKIDKNSNIPLNGPFVLFIKHHTKLFLLGVQLAPLDRVHFAEHFHMHFIFFWAVIIFIWIFEVCWNLQMY